MGRCFILGDFNTFYDWRLYLTAKDIPDAEVNTKYVNIDGMSGSIDLSESLTGEVTYKDRTISATFWTDTGNYKDRETLLQSIVSSLHGKKIKIIEPDDTDHYFYGRVKIKSKTNNQAYAEITLEAICEPWRYAIDETVRRVDVNSRKTTKLVINNNGIKTLCPVIRVTGTVEIIRNGRIIKLLDGVYKLYDIKLYPGVNIITILGNGSATFEYREATL